MKDSSRKERFRYELKYLINNSQAEILKQRLALIMDLDGNSIDGNYFIRSLYFDDVHNTAYYEKIDGLEEREKYRIRFYNFDRSYIMLELKGKKNNLTYKRQNRITEKEYNDIVEKNYDKIKVEDRKVLEEFINKAKAKNLIPSIIVDYNRRPYVYDVEDVRITFDEDISSGRFNYDLFSKELLPYRALEPNEVILEVKFNNFLPKTIKKVLDTVPKTRIAMSKFALCKEKKGV
jgi:hypothetical protein